MPELPEVETARRGIAPHLLAQRVREVVVRERRLRWPVPLLLEQALPGARITAVERRAKYLLLRAGYGSVIIHLGMSGSLRVVPASTTPGPHDHVDIVLVDGNALRLRDPRRFGAVLFTHNNPLTHRLLASLGPEPLSDAFNGAYLRGQARARRVAIKPLLMNSHIVAGVGNIYANEALFCAGIHPHRRASRIALARYNRLAVAVKQVLGSAIAAGGTTLRDFTASDGSPGLFRVCLHVYGRGGAPCPCCAQPIRRTLTRQRATYYCPHCQR